VGCERGISSAEVEKEGLMISHEERPSDTLSFTNEAPYFSSRKTTWCQVTKRFSEIEIRAPEL